MLLSGVIQGDKELSVELGIKADHIKDFSKPLKESADELMKSFQLNFDSEGGLFESGGWVPRKQNYSWPILQKTGAMRGSFAAEVSSDTATLTNWAPYFKYHQSNQPRKKLPRRIMMKIDEERRNFIIKAFQRHIIESTEK